MITMLNGFMYCVITAANCQIEYAKINMMEVWQKQIENLVHKKDCEGTTSCP